MKNPVSRWVCRLLGPRPAEFSGDGPMTPRQRMSWLLTNLFRNEPGTPIRTRNVSAPPRPDHPYSPSRMFTDHFLRQLPPDRCDILEIGCGSGSLCRRLAETGFTGSYTGIDISDRFDRTPVPGFTKTFIQANIHNWTPPGKFHLILSVSALEHIPDDQTLIPRLRSWLHQGGTQVHIIPARWSLPLYLWHGYRQYSPRSIANRFPKAKAYRLGGITSFLTHLTAITIPEIILRTIIRKSSIYRLLLNLCRLDPDLASYPPTHYAIIEANLPTQDPPAPSP